MTLLNLKHARLTAAAEARIMRRLERSRREGLRRFKARLLYGPTQPRAFGSLVPDYNDQRMELDVFAQERGHLKAKQRAMHLAYGFLRNVPYSAMEAKSFSKPNWVAVRQMVLAYKDEESGVVLQRLALWQDAAGVWTAPPPKPVRPRTTRWVQDPHSGAWHAPQQEQSS